MSEMVEQVARALRADPTSVLLNICNVHDNLIQAFARTAIKAMRPATRAMSAAAEEEGVVVGCCNITAEPAEEIWRIMVDAALAPVDTNPKGGDAVAAPFIGSAIGAAEAPKPLSDHRCSRREGFGDE